jgi:hypothetical protein
MDVRYVQIVPIELYSEANREAARSALFQERLIHKSMTDSELRDLVHEISPTGTEFYSVRIDGHRRATVDIVFCETTLCLVVVHDLGEGHALDFDLLDLVLTRRATEHAEIIAQKNALIRPVMDCLNARFSNGRYPIRPNYVFGFCCLCRDARLSEDCKSILKVMSEPSIVDVDDMLSSTRRALVAADLPPSDHRVFGRVVDVDPSTKSYHLRHMGLDRILHHGTGGRLSGRCNLLIALQVRLQSTWNRCYAFRRPLRRRSDRLAQEHGYRDSVLAVRARPRRRSKCAVLDFLQSGRSDLPRDGQPHRTSMAKSAASAPSCTSCVTTWNRSARSAACSTRKPSRCSCSWLRPHRSCRSCCPCRSSNRRSLSYTILITALYSLGYSPSSRAADEVRWDRNGSRQRATASRGPTWSTSPPASTTTSGRSIRSSALSSTRISTSC